MNPTQQIEAAAEKAAEEVIRALFPSGFCGDEENSAAGHRGETEAMITPIFIRFAAQLMQTGAMKGVESALTRADAALSKAHDVVEILEDSADSTNALPAQKANAEIRSTLAVVRPALASISALKGLGEDKP